MDIVADTGSYEAWLGRFTVLDEDDLALKHGLMADPHDPFPFFRGTYYRWLRRWPEVCPELIDAPLVKAVGDLHVENFGTWRDEEGRLIWGVNDFDEASTMPYTNDLVRLAASVRFARRSGASHYGFGRSCAAILQGYKRSLEAGGTPFVLEENHPELRRLAFHNERDPVAFWKKMTRLLKSPEPELPADARAALLAHFPGKRPVCEFRKRPSVGVGSLGKPRFIALREWDGGWVAREAKAFTPACAAWLAGDRDPAYPDTANVVRKAIRCHDPFYHVEKRWIIRRISPKCSRIELSQQSTVTDQAALLTAMGAETANVHLGAGKLIDEVRRDLSARPENWLKDAARRMFKALRGDWKIWRATYSGV